MRLMSLCERRANFCLCETYELCSGVCDCFAGCFWHVGHPASSASLSFVLRAATYLVSLYSDNLAQADCSQLLSTQSSALESSSTPSLAPAVFGGVRIGRSLPNSVSVCILACTTIINPHFHRTSNFLRAGPEIVYDMDTFLGCLSYSAQIAACPCPWYPSRPYPPVARVSLVIYLRLYLSTMFSPSTSMSAHFQAAL